jgi:tetratricopeptide (TPR) repeat protein
MQLIIQDEEGRKTVVPFSVDEISIGRNEGNTVRLMERNVSRRHARLIRESESIIVEDLGSSNGVRVNGERIATPTSLRSGDVIEIGDYDLAVEGLPVTLPHDTLPNGRPIDPAAVTDPAAEPEPTAIIHGADIQPPAALASPETQAKDTLRERAVVVPQPEPGGPGRMVLWGGLALVAVLAVAALAYSHFASRRQEGPPEDLCRKAQSATAAQDWAEAVSDLSLAAEQSLTCPFPVPQALDNARKNLEARGSLDQADKLATAGKYQQSIALLQQVPPDSNYAPAARLKAVEVRSQAIKQLSDAARSAIDQQHLDEAEGLLTQARQLDANAPVLAALEKEITERRDAAAPKATATEPKHPATETHKPDGRAPPPLPVSSQTRPIEERNSMADAEIKDGVHLIQTGDFQGGIERLQSALAEDPDDTFVARAHRNMGLAYVQKKQLQDAVPHLRIYLKLQPDSPERPRIEKMIADYEAQQGKP